LLGRKIARDGGAALKTLIEAMKGTVADLSSGRGTEFVALHDGLSKGVMALEAAAAYVVDNLRRDAREVLAGSVPFLKLMGIVAGGWQLSRAALVAVPRLRENAGEAAYYGAKVVTARFFSEHVLSLAPGLAQAVVHGGASVVALAEEQF
jgi:hypothetical protein